MTYRHAGTIWKCDACTKTRLLFFMFATLICALMLLAVCGCTGPAKPVIYDKFECRQCQPGLYCPMECQAVAQ